MNLNQSSPSKIPTRSCEKNMENVNPKIPSRKFGKMKTKASNKLKENSLVERVEFKTNLRAILHYTFSLKKKYFKKLMYLRLISKAEKVKSEIVEILYTKNCRKKYLEPVFQSLKKYAEYKRIKTFKRTLALQHFKFRYNKDSLRPYFQKWKIYARYQKKLQVKMEEAVNFYEYKITYKAFNGLCLYLSYKKIEKSKIESADELYSFRLKRKVFDTFLWYKIYRFNKIEKSNWALEHYREKLARTCLKLLKKNVERNIYVSLKLSRYSKIQSRKLKSKYFDELKNYVISRKVKKRKISLAENFYGFKWKKRYFRKLKLFVIYKRNKRQIEDAKVKTVSQIFDKRIIKICFVQWVEFNKSKLIKRAKLNQAYLFSKYRLKKYYLKSWIYFTYCKRVKIMKISHANWFYQKSIMRQSFKNWKNFVLDLKNYRQKLVEAKSYYRKNIIEESFRVILNAGFRKKDQQLEDLLTKQKQNLRLALKYSKIWRRKTREAGRRRKIFVESTEMYKRGTRKKNEKFEIGSELGDDLEEFQWDPRCFEKPRIPEYLRKISVIDT